MAITKHGVASLVGSLCPGRNIYIYDGVVQCKSWVMASFKQVNTKETTHDIP